jgi:hypothetical protein
VGALTHAGEAQWVHLVAGRRAGLVTAESATAKVRRVLPAVLARRIGSLLSTAGFTALTEVADGVRLAARAEQLDGAAQMLAGLGWAFTIERPDELKAEVRALAARLISNADAGE